MPVLHLLQDKRPGPLLSIRPGVMRYERRDGLLELNGIGRLLALHSVEIGLERSSELQ